MYLQIAFLVICLISVVEQRGDQLGTKDSLARRDTVITHPGTPHIAQQQLYTSKLSRTL